MFVVITRNFPPDVGGIQSLMDGLSRGLLSHGKVKVFADEFDNSKSFDEKSKLDIQRVSGIKLFRKFPCIIGEIENLFYFSIKSINDKVIILFWEFKSLWKIFTVRLKVVLVNKEKNNFFT